MALRIIAHSSEIKDNCVLLRNSEEDELLSNNPIELLEFIGEKYTDTERQVPYRELKVAWNLDVFISVILKRLGLKICRELIKPSHEALFEFKDGDVIFYDFKDKPAVLPEGVFDIFYIPSKIFGLQVREHKSYIYHLAQYFDDEDEVIDPIDIHAKASDLVDAFRQMQLNPYKLTSPIAVYESSVLNHMDVPTIRDIPRGMPENQVDELIQWSEECMARDWLEAYAVGRWEAGESWDFDISSAFGHHLSQLYNFRYATFAKSKYYCPDADYGLLKGTVTIYDGVKVHPIVCNQNGRLITPSGSSWYDIRTLNEIQFIEKMGIGEFKLDEGYFWRYKAPVRPFEIPLQRVFDLRHKGGMVKKLAKRIGAALWAKLIQTNADGSINTHYNPIMAMQTVTNSRLQVGQFIYQNRLQDHVIHVGVDGVRSSKKVSMRNEKVGMGAWTMNDATAVLVLSPGRVFTSEKKPQGLYYQDVVGMINEHPRDSYYNKTLKRSQTLSESVEMGDLKGLGEVRDFHTSIDINLARTSQDRDFVSFPRNGGELLSKKYYSEPIKL